MPNMTVFYSVTEGGYTARLHSSLGWCLGGHLVNGVDSALHLLPDDLQSQFCRQETILSTGRQETILSTGTDKRLYSAPVQTRDYTQHQTRDYTQHR